MPVCHSFFENPKKKKNVISYDSYVRTEPPGRRTKILFRRTTLATLLYFCCCVLNMADAVEKYIDDVKRTVEKTAMGADAVEYTAAFWDKLAR